MGEKPVHALNRGLVIHPTAVVHPTAHLDDTVEVGAYAVIGAHAVIGAGTVVGPHCVIHDRVVLGRNNELASHVVIGGRPQDRAYQGERTRVVIGDGNTFSDFSSVDRATGEGLETRIGNGVYIMSSVKVSHNCRVEDGATLVSHTGIGGWVEVGDHAFLGGYCGIHQFVHIGRLAMVAAGSAAFQDVPPYVLVAGHRSRARSLNKVGLQRHGVPPADRQALRRAFRIFFQSGLPRGASLEALELEAAQSVHVRHFVEFIRGARERNRGIVRWQAETAS